MEAYTKLKIAGRGAMGVCYLARKPSCENLVILKEIQIEGLSHSERLSALNEAEILKKLVHPNIIRYHDSFLNSSSSLTISMEYGQGGTLYSRGVFTFFLSNFMFCFGMLEKILFSLLDRICKTPL